MNPDLTVQIVCVWYPRKSFVFAEVGSYHVSPSVSSEDSVMCDLLSASAETNVSPKLHRWVRRLGRVDPSKQRCIRA